MDIVFWGTLFVISIGLSFLWFLGGKVIEYALKVSFAFEVSTFFVGFVVIAIAADLPEIAVAITSALRGVSEIAVGDIIGANFCDVSLVTGIAATAAGSITIGLQERHRLLTLLGWTTVIMIVVFYLEKLTTFHGVILILIYLVSIFTVWKNRKITKSTDNKFKHLYTNEKQKKSTKFWLITKLFIFLIGVLGCSSAIVYFIELFTHLCNIPLETAGATILAIGTSLPELSLCLNALKRKEYSLALGPTLGTVLEQCTLVLGLLTVISKDPINMAPVRGPAIFMFIGFFVVLFGLLKKNINRSIGIVLLCLFVCYVVYHCFI
jgi:cation:H+ antiporter